MRRGEDVFDESVTHVVVHDLRRTAKLLGGCLAGKVGAVRGWCCLVTARASSLSAPAPRSARSCVCTCTVGPSTRLPGCVRGRRAVRGGGGVRVGSQGGGRAAGERGRESHKLSAGDERGVGRACQRWLMVGRQEAEGSPLPEAIASAAQHRWQLNGQVFVAVGACQAAVCGRWRRAGGQPLKGWKVRQQAGGSPSSHHELLHKGYSRPPRLP